MSRLTPRPLPSAIETDLTIALNAEHNGVIVERARLPQKTRRALEERLPAIEGYLAPARTDEIVVALVRVFAALASRSDDGIDAQTRAHVYADILADLPPFSIVKACDDFCRGKAGDRKWVPTAAELRAVAEAHVAPWRAEKARIERALAARVLDAESQQSKQSALDHARETARQLRAKVAGGDVDDLAQDGRSPAQRAVDWLEELASAPKPPMTLSPAARASMGLKDPA
jgi:hypothetical protein